MLNLTLIGSRGIPLSDEVSPTFLISNKIFNFWLPSCDFWQVDL